MVDTDSVIRRELDLLAPADQLPASDWAGVLARAGDSGFRRWRQPRGRLAFAAAILAVAVGTTAAIAANQHWWFFGEGPEPVSEVAVVMEGSWDGVPWALTAYRSRTDGVCFGVTPNPRDNPDGIGAAMGCSQIVGVRTIQDTKPSEARNIAYLMSGPNPPLPRYIAGPVIATANEIEVLFVNHRSLDAKTVRAPSRLKSDIRFYAARLPLDAVVRMILGRDNHGRVVARLQVPASESEGGSP
jgi:hypothetical protein